MCIVVPAKRGQSQDTARQLHAMRKKMVVLPILARRTGFLNAVGVACVGDWGVVPLDSNACIHADPSVAARAGETCWCWRGLQESRGVVPKSA